MHYKIKDDVDLSVLEEYGYERIGIGNSYFKDVSDEATIYVFSSKIVYCAYSYGMTLLRYNKQYIKDLIDAGLVEEVNND